MWRFLIHRLVGIAGVVGGVLVCVFLLPRLVPADPCLAMLGEKATDGQLVACHARHHLDQPLPNQFSWYLSNLLCGNMGTSIRTGRAVFDDLRDRLPATLELSLAALLITLLLGFPLGILAAYHHQTWLDRAIRGFTIIGGAMPVFLLGLLLKELFSGQVAWLPRTGRINEAFALQPAITRFYLLDAILTGNMEMFHSSLLHLALPALTLGIYTSAVLARIVRTAILDVLPLSYILAARARGVSSQRILLTHALRNAMVPALTVVGLTIGNLFSGTVLTEYVFSWPGIGRYAAEAARTNDFPAIIGVALVAALIYPLSHFLIEFIQRQIDPHMREG